MKTMKNLLLGFALSAALVCGSCGAAQIHTALQVLQSLIAYVDTTIAELWKSDKAYCEDNAKSSSDVLFACTEENDAYTYIIIKRNAANDAIEGGDELAVDRAYDELSKAVNEFKVKSKSVRTRKGL